MKRLRHPVRAAREPFGKAGLTLAILALVMAMVGGAYAAGGLTKSQEKQVTKIAKKFAGKPGANGTNGTNGTNGAEGKQGPEGKAGTNGENGESGKSVVIGNTAPGCGAAGGHTVEVEGSGVSKNVCNGSPWTAGGTLPLNSTETGSLAYGRPSESVTGQISLPISFPVKLAAELGEPNVEFVKKGASPGTHCTGTPQDPTAPSGFLCVYLAEEPPEADVSAYVIDKSGAEEVEIGASKAGAFFTALLTGEAEARIYGTWAVTG